MVPLESSGTVSYSHSIATLAVSTQYTNVTDTGQTDTAQRRGQKLSLHSTGMVSLAQISLYIIRHVDSRILATGLQTACSNHDQTTAFVYISKYKECNKIFDFHWSIHPALQIQYRSKGGWKFQRMFQLQWV